MKTKFFGLLLFILCTLTVAAQDTARTIDRVFTKDNKIYVGQITDDVKGDHLKIEVYQSGTYTIPYDNITKIQYRVDNPNYVEKEEAPATPTPSMLRKEHYQGANDVDLVAFNGYRASPKVTDKLVKKRNIGIGLFVGGISMIGIGAALLATTPKQSTTATGGLLITTPSPGTVIGVVMIAAGVGITIPGAAIWGSYSAKLRRAERANN